MTTPTALKPRVVLERALTLAEDWTDWKNHPEHGPRTARDLLAAWGSLHRLHEASQLPGEASPVRDLIKADSAALGAATLLDPALQDWRERARSLDAAWDGAVSEDTLHELELAAVTLFDELDRYTLARSQIERLAPDALQTDQGHAWVATVEACENWFEERPETFLPAVPLAQATLDACRPGLEEDETLWRTVLKHRLLEETWEDLEAGPGAANLRGSDKQSLPLIAIRWKGRTVQGYRRQDLFVPPPMAAAASAAEEPKRVSLVWHSPDRSLEARLGLPVTAVPGEELVQVNLYVVESGEAFVPTADLQRICLAGIERSLDERGRARFTVQELRTAEEELFLTVGGVPWMPLTSP